MKTKEVKQLLQRYFNGESTNAEEKALQKYFQSGDVAEELKKYTGFFRGISDLSDAASGDLPDEQIMDFIMKNEPAGKTNTRRLWQIVTGIAASVILVIGGMLLYQQSEQPFEDTFDNPDIAYAYAEQTLGYVSLKYNKGLEGLSEFDKLQTAKQPMQQGVEKVNEYMEIIEKMKNEP